MTRLLPLMLASCLLTACAAGPMRTPAPELKVPPPPNLTAPPAPLPPPASGRVPDLEANHLQVARAYHQLASQLCRLLEFLEAAPSDCQAWRHEPSTQP